MRRSKLLPGRTRAAGTAVADSRTQGETLRRPWLAAYDDGVPPDVEVPAGTLDELLDDAAERFAASSALYFLNRETTYRELRRDVAKLAVVLRRLGVRPRDRVAVLLPNCPQLVISLFAVLRLGAVVVPLNPAAPTEQLSAQLADCQAEVVICLDRAYTRLAPLRHAPGLALREVLVTSLPDYLPALGRLTMQLPRAPRRARAELAACIPLGEKVRLWSDELSRARGRSVPSAAHPHSPAVLLYPSTRGAADADRGAVLTHHSLLAGAAQCAAWLPDARVGREVILTGLPLFSPAGLVLCVLASTVLGAGLLLLPRAGSHSVLDGVADYRLTLIVGDDDFLRSLVGATLAGLDLRSVRAAVCAGGMLSPAEVSDLQSRLGGPVIRGFGLGAEAPILSATPMRRQGPDGSLGVPMPSTQVRLDDTGSMLVRGPGLFTGYWGRPDDTAHVLRDGWLHTRLRLRVDDDGWLWPPSPEEQPGPE